MWGTYLVAKQVKGISDLNKEYDEFLTDIDTLLNYVGTTYGLYIQVKETIKAVRDLKTVSTQTSLQTIGNNITFCKKE